MTQFLQLAPMQAVTDVKFMNVYHTVFGGFTEMMAPYIQADSNSPTKIHILQKHFVNLNSNIKLVPQLLSNDANGIVYFANSLYNLGYNKINWNLGCPFPVVTKKQRGSGLLPFPNKIEKILDTVCAQIKPQLSIKIRLGYNNPNDIVTLAPILNKYNLNELIIHPRTAIQKYNGKANTQAFENIKSLLKMPLVYNGDIIEAKQVFELEKKNDNIKGFMIGRGALINPFITNQINGIPFSATQKKAKYLEFYTLLYSNYKNPTNNLQAINKMKHLWRYFSQGFKNGDIYFKQLAQTNNVAQFEKIAIDIINNAGFIY